MNPFFSVGDKKVCPRQLKGSLAEYRFYFIHPSLFKRRRVNTNTCGESFFFEGTHPKKLWCKRLQVTDCGNHSFMAFRCSVSKPDHPFTAPSKMICCFLQ